ncbi:MAG: c-type cytochrome [Candidatus Solibacter sp.]
MRHTALAVLFISCGILAGQSKTEIKKIPIKQTSPASGKEMFVEYCASCHGKEGKGDGPAAVALKTPPSNLATLAARNKGTFPALGVAQAIQGDGSNFAHGSRDMPIWGQVFHTHETNSTVKLRIANLTDYIQSLQTK